MPEISNKDRLKDITDSIEKGIKELFQSDKYKEYLKVASKFHNYSLNNQILIMLQCPNASRVAGFGAWRDKFERNVKKGAHGIKIIAPTPYKRTIEKEKLDPDTKLPVLDADGKVITEEKTIQIPMYKPVTVFDVSSTEGKPLPELAENLVGDVKNYDVFMEALKRSAPVPIEFQPLSHGMDGYFSLDEQKIVINSGMSEIQTVCATIHEITHSMLDNTKADAAEKRSKQDEEVTAESVAYCVSSYYSIETSQNSFGYIASYSQGKELPELKKNLELINKTSASLINSIDKNYADIMKERGLDKIEVTQPELTAEIAVEEPVPETAPDNGYMPDPLMSVAAMNAYGYTDADMLPLSKERALELMADDVTVYTLSAGNKAEMAFDENDIINHSGICGITREDWDAVKVNYPIKEDKSAIEQRFLNNPADSFAIYQLDRDNEQTAQKAFMGTDYLDKKGLTVERGEYIPVYTGELLYSGDTLAKLNELYTRFNASHPLDYKGHSLSVSDIVVLKQDGVVSCHYVDSWGFKELPGFLSGKNPMRTVEDIVEQNDNQLDGIVNNMPVPTVAELEAQSKSGKPISLMDLATAVKREKSDKAAAPEKKPSFLAKLKAYQTDQKSRTIPHKKDERGI